MTTPAPTITPASALALWYRALGQEFGTALRVAPADVKRVEIILYTARQHSGDPRLQTIMIARPAKFPEEFWLVKKAVEL